MKNKKIRVAYAALAPFISGSERSLQQTILAVKEQLDVTLIVPPLSPMIEWAQKNNVRCCTVELEYCSLWSSFTTYIHKHFSLIRIFRKYRIDIVHSNQLWSYPVVSLAATVVGVKKVCHFRDPIDKHSNWWLPRRVDKAIFISRHIESMFLKNIESKRFKSYCTMINPVSLPPKIDEVEFRTKRDTSSEALGLKKNAFTFGYIGQISPVKGVLEMLHALSKLNSGWQLVIAGDATEDGQDYLKKCMKAAEDLNISPNVTFIGFLDNVGLFYQAVDCVLMLSKAEPLGRVPLEAAGYFKPTIANDVGGLPETICHGKTGWLTPSGDESSLLICLNEALEMDAWKLGGAARAMVEEIADPSLYAKKLVAEYETCLHNKRPL